MDLNIIHDDRIIGRIEPLIEQCEKYGIGYKVWAAIIDKPKVLENITASHKMIVQWAKDNGLKEVCIAEDDLGFTCDDAWRYYLENKPEKFDVYIGGSRRLMPMAQSGLANTTMTSMVATAKCTLALVWPQI
jgi:hypothetical protein